MWHLRLLSPVGIRWRLPGRFKPFRVARRVRRKDGCHRCRSAKHGRACPGGPGGRMIWTIDAIREADLRAGRYFFSADTMKFFSSRVLPTVYEGPGGIYFITSEKFTASNGGSESRKYTIRQFTPDPVNIRTVAGFNQMSKRQAQITAKVLAAGHGVVHLGIPAVAAEQAGTR